MAKCPLQQFLIVNTVFFFRFPDFNTDFNRSLSSISLAWGNSFLTRTAHPTRCGGPDDLPPVGPEREAC